MQVEYRSEPDTEIDAYEPRDEVEELFRGAVDLHVHPGPSPLPRRVSIHHVATAAAEVGFRGMVVKSHHASMQTDVLALKAAGAVPGDFELVSGVALNRTVGGVNPYAVELFLKLGARVVWMPTVASRAHYAHEHDSSQTRFPQTAIELREHEPIPVVDEAGRALPEVREVMELIAEQQAILNFGHLAADDIDVLIRTAREVGIERMVVSHPSFIIGGSPERAREWANQGAYIEHCLSLLTSRRVKRMDLEGLLGFIRTVGPSSSVISSDLGQRGNPLPLTAYRVIVPQLIDAGVEVGDLARMMQTNPAGLLFENSVGR